MAKLSLQVIASSDPTDDRRAAIARDLSELTRGDVRFSHHDRMLYATDASFYQVEPIGVVSPRSVDEVPAIVRYCAQNNLPIVPRGGGTGLVGQTVNAAIVLDFSRYCTSLRGVDKAARTAAVEPGIVLDHLNASLADHGLMFGPDVATSTHACLGGMIGNNSAGTHSIVYGRTVDNLRAVDVVLADGTPLRLEPGAALRDERTLALTNSVAKIVRPIAGEIRKRFPTILRRVDGYNLDLILDQLEASTDGGIDHVNLASLICGSEGTLAVITGATLDLVDPPPRKGLGIIAFDSLEESLAAVGSVLETSPSAVELLDDVVLKMAQGNAQCRRYVEMLPTAPSGATGAVLYVEYFAEDEAALADRFTLLESQFEESRVQRHTDPDAMSRAWALRKAGEPLLHALPGVRKPITFVEDAAVDPSRLLEFVQAFRDLLDAHGTKAAYYAHASVGCLHIRPLINLSDAEDVARMERIAEAVTDLAVEFGGALSGEHGDGRARSHLLQRFFGAEICRAMADIKKLFDPENLLNPGNIVDPPGMTEHMRTKPSDAILLVPSVETYYRFEPEHGFEHAVTMCNGAGICRKTEGGTMCPSYRATRDERHATRGRGNALRLAITGQLGSGASAPNWRDEETLRTLDLCLSCKACKTECPSNVDIAKLKSEYLAQRYREMGGPPRSIRTLANVRRLNRLGSTFHPFANMLSKFPLTRSILNKRLDLDKRRSLPAFRRSLYRWFASRAKPDTPREAPTVVYLPDCFSVYSEPNIGEAAINVLERLGYRVVLPKMGCCGRPHLSAGMLEDAQRVCADAAGALGTLIEGVDPVAIVATEPSCLSAIVDDWPDLNMNASRDMNGEIVDRSMLIEQFIDSRWDAHPRPIKHNAERSSQSILLHAHCHQKALWGAESSATLLRRFAGDNLTVLDTGCCGMAGAFGMMRDHYDLSMQIGELSLFPLVREQPEATILAPGTSCRHQLHDGAQRDAMHPIEFIAQMLEA